MQNNSSIINTILIVEDEVPLAEAIKIQIKQAGYEAVIARGVDQAMEYLETVNKINVIWLDHYLQASTGLDLVHKVKNDEKLKEIPIFLVSNTASNDKVYSYLQLGIEKYYVKSDKKLKEIISDITKYLETKKSA